MPSLALSFCFSSGILNTCFRKRKKKSLSLIYLGISVGSISFSCFDFQRLPLSHSRCPLTVMAIGHNLSSFCTGHLCYAACPKTFMTHTENSSSVHASRQDISVFVLVKRFFTKFKLPQMELWISTISGACRNLVFSLRSQK